MKKNKLKRPYKIKKTKLKEAQSALGLASRPYRIELTPGFDELVDIRVPIDSKLCSDREINPATIKLFKWNEQYNRFRIVESSSIDRRWENIRARIFESGIYVAAGAVSNPWAENAVRTLRTFGPALHDPEIGRIIRDKLCLVILCPNMLGNIFEEIGEPSQHGLPSLPSGDLCQICLGGWPGHLVDLYPEPRTPNHPEPCDLNRYLDRNPRVKQAIVWRDWEPRGYDDWTASEKADLANAFERIRGGGIVELPESAPATSVNPSGFLSRLTNDDGWKAYIAHIAQSLVVDACRWVDWTMATWDSDTLSYIFDSQSLFKAVSGGQAIVGFPPWGFISHGDPTRVYRWLRREGLIADNQTDTIGRVLEWCRDNLVHYSYGNTPDNLYDHWQYRGYPPIERVISGTTHPRFGFAHWTAGCWGTSGFLRLALRTINIPALFKIPCSHAHPYFPTIGKYLSHGDDPYSRGTREAGVAGVDLLIDEDQFEEWFGEDVTPEECTSNVGRRVRELTGES